ncbi:hypothetical protein ECPA10_0949, partial [Escherichia coli PA10]
FFRPRIKAVLVGDDQQCDELRIAGMKARWGDRAA